MNFLQLVQRLRQECGVSGTGPSTVVGQTGEYKRLVDWIAAAWLELQQEYPTWSWNWLRSTFTFQTVTPVTAASTAASGATDIVVSSATGIVSGMEVTGPFILPGTTVTNVVGTTVSLSAAILGDHTGTSVTFMKSTYSPSTVGISSDFAQWKPETFRIYQTSSGFGSETKLIYVPYQDWRDIYELGPRIGGRPLHVTVKPDLTLGIGPYPNAAYTVTGDYVTIPQELTADADIPVMPEQFHMAIVYLAMMYYSRFEAAGEIYNDAAAKYDSLLRRVAMNQLPELMNPPAMV